MPSPCFRQQRKLGLFSVAPSESLILILGVPVTATASENVTVTLIASSLTYSPSLPVSEVTLTLSIAGVVAVKLPTRKTPESTR